MKTADLIGPTLDWAVAKCEKIEVKTSKQLGYTYDPTQPPSLWFSSNGHDMWTPSTDWSQGGPIIEREGIDVLNETKERNVWASLITGHPHVVAEGPTPLVAAMRAYVASKLGDEVDIPKELQ